MDLHYSDLVEDCYHIVTSGYSIYRVSLTVLTFLSTHYCFFCPLGMIRLPKVAKSAIKNRPVPRTSLVNIVKELGKFCIGSTYIFKVYNMSDVLSGCFLPSAVQAPLKLKAPRGAPTPINRNQANQPRSATALLGKRPFDSVSSHFLSLLLSFFFSLALCLSYLSYTYCTTEPLITLTLFPVGGRTLLLHQREAIYEQHEDDCPVSHKAAES